jgi:hypothetical protein
MLWGLFVSNPPNFAISMLKIGARNSELADTVVCCRWPELAQHHIHVLDDLLKNNGRNPRPVEGKSCYVLHVQLGVKVEEGRKLGVADVGEARVGVRLGKVRQ